MERLEARIGKYLEEEPGDRCFWWNGSWFDRAFLRELADRAETALAASGFSEGQRLAVLMPNSPMFLALTLAAWRLGGAVCPLNVKSGLPSLVSTLSLLDPFAVIASEEIRKEVGPALSERGWPHVSSSLTEPPPAFTGKPGKPEPRELAVVFSTSGTTGDPKAVPLTLENIRSNCEACLKALVALRPGDVFLNVLPNFHSFGFTACTILPIFLKGAQVLVPNFMPPRDTLSAIAEAPANVVILVPTMLSFLLGLLEREDRNLRGTVKLLVTGGDRYNPLMDAKAEALIGVGVQEGYGITECSPVLSVNGRYERRKLGTVGEFLDGFSWQLRGEDGSAPETGGNPQNGEGVLWVKGPSVTKGYFRVGEIDTSRFDDGWFNTGDYVRVEDGCIRVLDRVTDIIIVGGFNVYPQEVEGVLQTHPAVQTAVVVGIPHAVSGEVPKAYILKKPKAEITESDIVHFCKDRLAHYKVPRKVEFVDVFPLSGTGKVLRRVLRERERA
ncbi:MAG: AMP-binding protein [Synergistaceae bacterium]|jgi:long-chain acyl-CoA synthetase|nr:AMP-binding protein [Synergistaceae bacterium]